MTHDDMVRKGRRHDDMVLKGYRYVLIPTQGEFAPLYVKTLANAKAVINSYSHAHIRLDLKTIEEYEELWEKWGYR
jgi:hypothetical protein